MKRRCKYNRKRTRRNPSKTLRTKSFRRYFQKMTCAEKMRVAKMTTPYYASKLKTQARKKHSMYLKSGRPTAWTEMVLGWYKQDKK